MGNRESWSSAMGSVDIPNRLLELKTRVGALAGMNKRYNVCAMYHNHSGSMVGASLWDLWMVLREFDSQWVGSNFDVGHATVEGGLGGWVVTTRLMSPLMHGIAIKDFYWAKSAKGPWEPHWCPLGEGMVDFKAYFAMLKHANFSGPVQLHFEYPLGGADTGATTLSLPKATVLAAFRRDLARLRGWLSEAELV